MKKFKLIASALFFCLLGPLYGQVVSELENTYLNLQASIIQLNFAKTDLSAHKTQERVLGAYASYLQRAVNQEGITAGVPKIGGNDPIPGIDVIVKKDPSSKPIQNPRKDPTIDQINRLEKTYLDFKLKEVKEKYEREQPKKSSYEAFLKREITQAEKEKAALPQADTYVKSKEKPAPPKDKPATEVTKMAKAKSSSTTKAKSVIPDGFGPIFYGIYSGSSSPVGEFSDFAKTGVDFGAFFDFGSTKNWGWGVDFNRQSNKFEAPISLLQIPSILNPRYRISTSGGKGAISNSTFTVGPIWRVATSPKTYFEVYSKVGVSRIGNISGLVTFDTIGKNGNPDEKNILFTMNASKKTALGVTSGMRFGLQATPKLSIFINPQYVYSKTTIDYTYATNLNRSYTYLGNPLGTFLHDLTYATKTINPSYFNMNVGLRFGIGGKKGGSKEISQRNVEYSAITEEPEQRKEFTCNTTISSPTSGSTIGSKTPLEIIGTASGKTATIRVIKLSDKTDLMQTLTPEQRARYKSNLNSGCYGFKDEIEQTKFQPITQTVKVKNGSIHEKIDANKLTPGTYSLEVTDESGCTQSVEYFTKSGTETQYKMNLDSVQCLGYQSKEGFKYRICFRTAYKSETCNLTFNNAPNSGFKIKDPNNGYAIVPYTEISGFSLQTHNQNTDWNYATYCVDVTVPIGTNLLIFQTQGDDCISPAGGRQGLMAEAEAKLKPCICDFCDGVEFETEGGMRQFYGTNMLLSDVVHPIGQNVVAAKAEIIEVTQIANSECLLCNKDATQWVKFNGGEFGNLFDNSVSGGFSEANNGVLGNTHNTLSFTNQFGGSMNANHFMLNLSVPSRIQSSCCCYKLKLKIRYTFSIKDPVTGACKYCSIVRTYTVVEGNGRNCPSERLDADFNTNVIHQIPVNTDKK